MDDEELREAKEYDVEVRYTHILLVSSDTESDGCWVQVCLWCGLVVGVDILHEGRCVGEELRREDDALVLADWEERVTAGELDDDDE